MKELIESLLIGCVITINYISVLIYDRIVVRGYIWKDYDGRLSNNSKYSNIKLFGGREMKNREKFS